MRVIGTSSQVTVGRPPEEVYGFVTKPDNWVGTHPVTAGVRGDTQGSAAAGAQWIEVIQPGPGAPAFEVEWWATIAVPGRLWVIETERLAFPGLRCRIVYTFVAEGGGTRFHRDMASLVGDQAPLDPAMEAALASPAVHDAYLAAIKTKLESGG